jgi:hypothetical protein
MRDLAALAYADLCGLRNQIRTIWRTPLRLVPWVLFAFGIPALLVLRIRLFHHAGHAGAMPNMLRLDTIVLAPVITFSVLLIANMRVGLFAGRAEARFVSLSPLPRALTIAYLQLRTVTFDAIRLAISTLYLLFVFLPPSVGGAQFFRDLFLGPVVLVAFASLLLPRRLAKPWLAALYVAGAVIAILVGGSIVLQDLLRLGPFDIVGALPALAPVAAVVLKLPPWHPGVLLVDPGASIIGLTAIAAIAATAVAVLARTGRDAFPELYDLSQAHIDLRERLKKRALFTVDSSLVTTEGRRTATAGAADRVPGGLAVLLWKAWLEFSRTSTPRVRVISVAFLFALGLGAAFIERSAPAILPSVLASGAFTFIAIGLGSAQRLAGELRRPLFHLASPTLFERLATMTIAQAGISWVRGAIIVAGAIAGGIDLRIALGALVVLFCVFVLLVAAGFALFSLWPNALDRRGPLALVRVLILTVIFIIGVGIGTALAILTSPVIGVATGCAVALAGTVALLGLATWRISSRIDLLTLDQASA